MNKSFTEILDGLEPEELEPLLDGVAVHNTADEKRRIAALVRRPERNGAQAAPRRRFIPRRAWIGIAACIAILAALGAGSIAYAAEAKEYKAAVEFFNEYELSAEGLTRGEIKAVYKDIKTEKFTYDKTGEVLAHSLFENSVPGYDLSTELASPEDMRTAWMELRSAWISGKQAEENEVYIALPVFKEGGSLEVVASEIEKKRGGESLWSVRIEGVDLDKTFAVGGGVIAAGRIASEESGGDRPVIVKADEDGELLWRRDAYLDSDWTHVSAATELKNGELAFIGSYLVKDASETGGNSIWETCFVKYSSDGEPIASGGGYVGEGSPRLIAPFGEGCIAALDNAAVVFISQDGSFSESAAYSEAGREYRITDMLEYEGSLFLSCYSYPAPDPDDDMGGEMNCVHTDASPEEIEEWYKEHDKWYETHEGYSDETFMSTLLGNYKAVLLRIDPESSEPQVFYSVDGAFGGALERSGEGEMVWRVQNISSAGVFPMLNSHEFEILCAVNLCRFDSSGSLVGTEDTGEIEMIWK